MRVNYKELADRYRISGQTKKEFGQEIGMSPSMVSYYLKKAEQEEQLSKGDIFSRIELSTGVGLSCIKISTSKGVTIEIPI